MHGPYDSGIRAHLYGDLPYDGAHVLQNRSIKDKVGENGKAFGAISSKELAQAVKDQFGLTVDKKKIVIDEPIKALGDHEVKIKLHPKVSAVLRVNVIEA